MYDQSANSIKKKTHNLILAMFTDVVLANSEWLFFFVCFLGLFVFVFIEHAIKIYSE